MARQDEMRIGDAERDAVTTALHDHFAAGRLDREELDERLDATLASKTQGDLKAIVRDLPEPNGMPEPARGRTPAQAAHPCWGQGRHHPHRSQGHGHGPSPAFPLMIGVFVVVAFTMGLGAAVLAVLQLALLVFVVKAVLLALGRRHTHQRQK